MSLSEVLSAVSTTIGSVIDWAESFLGTITTSNGLILVPVILSFTLFGVHVLKSLMNR